MELQRLESWGEYKGTHGTWSLIENGSKQAIVKLIPNDSILPFGYRTAYFGSVAEARLGIALIDSTLDEPADPISQIKASGFELVKVRDDGAKIFHKPAAPGHLRLVLEDAGERGVLVGYEQKNGLGGNLIAWLQEPTAEARELCQDNRANALGFDPFLADVSTVLALADARHHLHGNWRRPLKLGEETSLIEQLLDPARHNLSP